MTRTEFEAACRREGYEIGEGEIQAHTRREPHTHDFDARLFIVEGSLTLVRGQDRSTYGPGESCAVPAGTMHAEHTEADGARLVYGRRATSRAPKAH
jgi:quercetin dioxygenase-like cupin family protein